MVAALLLCSGLAQAQQQEEFNKAVASVGAQGSFNGPGTLGYFRVVGDFALPCMYDVVYFNPANDFGKAAQNTILAAKNTGHNLSRVVYDQGADQLCYLHLVEFE